ncbi:acetyl-CoA carboxylase biotin carboxylase subunit, partial [Enterococcus faecium]
VQIMKYVGYGNAGTVELLVEGDDLYFIEVNPRVQVEHTITEMITDIEIVTTQLLIAQGLDLHKEIGLPQHEGINLIGSA